MTPVLRPLVLLVFSGLLLVACKKDQEPQAVPVPSGAAATAPSAAPEATTSAVASAAPAPPTPPPVVQQQPIDACCSALSSASGSAKNKADKDKLLQASKICSGIAAKVKTGASQRSSALTTIRSQLAGVSVPSECH